MSVKLQNIAAIHDADPFVPFDLVLGDGVVIRVPSRTHLARPHKGDAVVVFDRDGIARYIDLLLVSRLDVGTKHKGSSCRRTA